MPISLCRSLPEPDGAGAAAAPTAPATARVRRPASVMNSPPPAKAPKVERQKPWTEAVVLMKEELLQEMKRAQQKSEEQQQELSKRLLQALHAAGEGPSAGAQTSLAAGRCAAASPPLPQSPQLCSVALQLIISG